MIGQNGQDIAEADLPLRSAAAIFGLQPGYNVRPLVLTKPFGLFGATSRLATFYELGILSEGTYKDGKVKKKMKATRTVKVPSRIKIQRHPW